VWLMLQPVAHTTSRDSLAVSSAPWKYWKYLKRLTQFYSVFTGQWRGISLNCIFYSADIIFLLAILFEDYHKLSFVRSPAHDLDITSRKDDTQRSSSSYANKMR